MISKTYSWQSSQSTISKMEVDTSAVGKYAILHAGDAPGNQQKLATELLNKGFQAVPSVIDGENVLITTLSFRNNDKVLTKALLDLGAVEGKPDIQKEKIQKDGNIFQRSRDAILRQAARLDGVFGIAGHVFLNRRGVILEDKSLENASKLFGTTTMILAVFGNGARAINESVDTFAEQTRNQLAKSGIDVPRSEYENELMHMQDNRSFPKKVYDFVARNPLPINYAIALPGHLSIVQSGIKDREYGRTAAGTIATSGALTAMLVKEKPIEEQRLPDNPNILRRIGSKIQERPVRVLGLNQLFEQTFMWADVLRMKNTYTNRLNGFTDKKGNYHKSHYELLNDTNSAINNVLLGDIDWSKAGAQGSDIEGRIGEWRKAFLETNLEQTEEAKASLSSIMNDAKGILSKVSSSINPKAILEKYEKKKGESPHEQQLNAVLASKELSGLEKLQEMLTIKQQVERELTTAEKAEASEAHGKNPLKNAYTAAISNIALWTMSSIMTVLTSKRHGSEIGGDDRDSNWLDQQGPAGKMLLGRYAEMALNVAPENREHAITEMSTHLSTLIDKRQAGTDLIRNALSDMVTTMEKSPFSTHDRSNNTGGKSTPDLTRAAGLRDTSVQLENTSNQPALQNQGELAALANAMQTGATSQTIH